VDSALTVRDPEAVVIEGEIAAGAMVTAIGARR
jgi:hypothetical protein